GRRYDRLQRQDRASRLPAYRKPAHGRAIPADRSQYGAVRSHDRRSECFRKAVHDYAIVRAAPGLEEDRRVHLREQSRLSASVRNQVDTPRIARMTRRLKKCFSARHCSWLKIFKHSRDEVRFHALGKTEAGRLLHITFTMRAPGKKIRVISEIC